MKYPKYKENTHGIPCPHCDSIVVTLMLASELSGVGAAEPEGLIGRWDFDDGTGKDLSGNSNHYR